MCKKIDQGSPKDNEAKNKKKHFRILFWDVRDPEGRMKRVAKYYFLYTRSGGGLSLKEAAIPLPTPREEMKHSGTQCQGQLHWENRIEQLRVQLLASHWPAFTSTARII